MQTHEPEKNGSDAKLARRFRTSLFLYLTICVVGYVIFIPFRLNTNPPPPALMISGPVMGFYQLSFDTFAIAAPANLVVLPMFVSTFVFKSWVIGALTLLMWMAAGFVCYSVYAV